MTEQAQIHPTKIEMAVTAPPQVAAGAEFALKVRVACPSACDLRGATVRILAEDGATVTEIPLAGFREGTSETDEFVVKAPAKTGVYTWTAVLAASQGGKVGGAQATDGPVHEASPAPVSFVVEPHSTSIAVWDVPSPIPFSSSFKIKVGVKCLDDCSLTDKKIAIFDQDGAQVATGTLGDAPWEATGALYWTEVELTAPVTPGVFNWTVAFPAQEMRLAHEGAAGSFAFATANAPEHTLTVTVVDKVTRAPVQYAMVTLHSSGSPYRDRTDEAGVACLHVPKGTYALYVSIQNYLDWQTVVDVASDAAITAEIVFAPDDFG